MNFIKNKEKMVVRNVHEWGLTTSTALSQYYDPDMITPIEVIALLNKAKISFVLVGLHGYAGWMNEPRATQGVDVLVAAKQQKKAVQLLIKAFPQLEPVDLPVVTRLRDRENHQVLIDVMKLVQHPYRVVFKHTNTIHSGGQTYRVPCLEMALVMKFSAMTSLYRADEDKFQDAHDFIRMVKANPDVDLGKITELGSLIYPDGGKDVLEMVQKVRAGESLTLQVFTMAKTRAIAKRRKAIRNRTGRVCLCLQSFATVLTGFSSMPAIVTSRRMFMWSAMNTKRSSGSHRLVCRRTNVSRGKN